MKNPYLIYPDSNREDHTQEQIKKAQEYTEVWINQDPDRIEQIQEGNLTTYGITNQILKF